MAIDDPEPEPGDPDHPGESEAMVVARGWTDEPLDELPDE